MKNIYLVMIVIMLSLSYSCSEGPIKVDNLTIDMRENPIGFENPKPQFGWQIKSDLNGVMQTSYRIIVAKTKKDLKNIENLVWDSGVVDSDKSTFVQYEGAVLESRENYFWRVLVTTNKGDAKWSSDAHWSMTILDDDDWKAKWIGIDSLFEGERLNNHSRVSARYLRKEFSLDNKISSARLYITGLGLYECYLNGEKISNDVFAPTASDYDKSVNYNVYDVTDFVNENNNTIGVVLGNGRYITVNEGSFRHYGLPKMFCQLEIIYKDGSKDVIVSDETWKLTTNGPIISNNEFDGEEYNANLELNGWNSNGYDDSSWLRAQIVGTPSGDLIAQSNPNIKIMETIKPASIKTLNDSVFIIDMGQNMVGWLAVNLDGVKDMPIKMRFAELIKDDGSLYMDNLRNVLVTDIYTPSTNGNFSWEPRFTYHGFRFVEITGLNYTPELNNFEGKVIYDEMETVGSFNSSNETLNQIHKNAYWGIRGNYRSMPTDCPQRDERMGWLGDRAMGCIGESFMFSQGLLYEKWLRDIEQTQREDGCVPDVAPTFWANHAYSDNVTWPSAYICVADMLYNQYGDERPIKERYQSMRRWIHFVRDTQMKDFIVVNDTYGDWCLPPERKEMIHSSDPARKTDGKLLSTTYFYRMLNIMNKFATICGYQQDAAEYSELASKVKEACNNEFLNASDGSYSNNTVTANLISLMQGLAPDSLHEKIFANVVERTEGEFDSHVSTGLIGIQFLMRGLTHHGRSDLAYKIATNRSYPSWGYMIDEGATTIWELWNGSTADPAMNSANHVMLLGDLMIWYYEDLAGIKSDPANVGFKNIIMSPCFPKGLDFVDASYDSIHGKVGSSWKKDGAQLSWNIEIPANTTALVSLPASSIDQITEGGEPLLKNSSILSAKVADNVVVAEVGSGRYEFLVK